MGLSHCIPTHPPDNRASRVRGMVVLSLPVREDRPEEQRIAPLGLKGYVALAIQGKCELQSVGHGVGSGSVLAGDC